MRFKNYLIENASNGVHSITYQKLLMALDTAHISKTENSYEFNLGAVVKDSSLFGLIVKIKTGKSLSVKLGKTASGKYVIEIIVDELPDRMEIDSLMSSNKSLMNKFIECVSYYKSTVKGASTHSPTKQEKVESYYDKGNIEKSYDDLISDIESRIKEYKIASKELQLERDTTVNAAKKNTLDLAIEKLKSEYIGNNEAEFIKKIKSLPSAEFLTHLEKDSIKKILKRLESYYNQKLV